MARKILATFMALLGVSGAAVYLYYAPAHVTLSVIDPPPQSYDSSIQSIVVTLNRVDIHAANAGDQSGWYKLSQTSTVDLLTVLDVSKILATAPVPPGKYSEIRFFASQVLVTINGLTETFTISGGNQTGIKVVIAGGFQIFGGQTLTLRLDLAFMNSEIMNNPTMMLTPVATAKIVS